MKIVNIKEFERILKNKHGKIGDDGRTTVADLFITGGKHNET